MTPPGSESDFRPSPWLANRHVQSIYPSLPLRRPWVGRRCEVLLKASRAEVVDCGEGVRLLAHRATQEALGREPARRIAILLHGWEGSADSLYLLSLASLLLEHGYEVVRLNLRDHGDSHHLNEGIFHSCRIAEVVGAVRRLQELAGGRRVDLAGFSLGGNFSLRVAARARAAGIDLAHVVAICPVLDPEHTLRRLEGGWVLYRWYFVRKWKRSLVRKQAAWPSAYDLDDVLGLSTLTDMTRLLATRYGGYPTLEDYLRGYAIVGDALEGIDCPARIIAAADDPIIPAEDLGRLAKPASLSITLTPHGGHCGYYDSQHGSSWLERQVLATLAAR